MFVLLVTSNFSQTENKIQSGSWSVNQSIQDYSLDNNKGERAVIVEIKFSKSFNSRPKVFLTVNQIDASKEFNSRFNVEAISISRDGFSLKVKTWSDTKIFSISGNWIAIANM